MNSNDKELTLKLNLTLKNLPECKILMERNSLSYGDIGGELNITREYVWMILNNKVIPSKKIEMKLINYFIKLLEVSKT